jgi:hypothetical protein
VQNKHNFDQTGQNFSDDLMNESMGPSKLKLAKIYLFASSFMPICPHETTTVQ